MHHVFELTFRSPSFFLKYILLKHCFIKRNREQAAMQMEIKAVLNLSRNLVLQNYFHCQQKGWSLCNVTAVHLTPAIVLST